LVRGFGVDTRSFLKLIENWWKHWLQICGCRNPQRSLRQRSAGMGRDQDRPEAKRQQMRPSPEPSVFYDLA
jgi:hypothetical protein